MPLIGKNIAQITLPISLVICLCSGTAYGAAPPPPLTPDSQSLSASPDEAALRSEASEYETDFAAGNASAIAAMCSPDCLYIDSDGNEYHGRADIEQVYTNYFKNEGSRKIKVAIESIKFPAPDVAIEEGTTTSVSKSGVTRGADKYMVVHVKRDGKWSMYRITETSCPPPLTESKLKDLSWLIGSWTATGPQAALHLKVRYAGDSHFLFCTFMSDKSDQPMAAQVIGWDPRGQQLIAWHYGSNGGFGTGIWKQTPAGWTQQTRTVEPDGSRGAATYTIRKIDDNTFVWSAKDRMLDGLNLPSTADIKVTRDLHTN